MARIKEREWMIPSELVTELIALGSGTGAATGDSLAAPSVEDLNVIAQANQIAAETWFAASNWANITKNLQSWQRSLLYSLGRIRRSDREISVKQATQGLKALEQARALGWCESQLPL